MNKNTFTSECRKIVCNYEIAHSRSELLYRSDVVFTENRYTDTGLYAECYIKPHRIYRIAYDNQYDRLEVKIYILKDTLVLYRTNR